MGLISETDIASMLKALGGEEQIDLHSNYEDLTLYAIVDIGYRRIQLGDGSVAAMAPSVMVRTADIEEFVSPGEVDNDGTFATVRDVRYRVLDHQPDKHGFSTLILGRDE